MLRKSSLLEERAHKRLSKQGLTFDAVVSYLELPMLVAGEYKMVPWPFILPEHMARAQFCSGSKVL